METWAKLIPELLVMDLDESLYFWRDLIGFSVAYDRPEDRFAFLEFGRRPDHAGAARPSHAAVGACTA